MNAKMIPLVCILLLSLSFTFAQPQDTSCDWWCKVVTFIQNIPATGQAVALPAGSMRIMYSNGDYTLFNTLTEGLQYYPSGRSPTSLSGINAESVYDDYWNRDLDTITRLDFTGSTHAYTVPVAGLTNIEKQNLFWIGNEVAESLTPISVSAFAGYALIPPEDSEEDAFPKIQVGSNHLANHLVFNPLNGNILGVQQTSDAEDKYYDYGGASTWNNINALVALLTWAYAQGRYQDYAQRLEGYTIVGTESWRARINDKEGFFQGRKGTFHYCAATCAAEIRNFVLFLPPGKKYEDYISRRTPRENDVRIVSEQNIINGDVIIKTPSPTEDIAEESSASRGRGSAARLDEGGGEGVTRTDSISFSEADLRVTINFPNGVPSLSSFSPSRADRTVQLQITLSSDDASGLRFNNRYDNPIRNSIELLTLSLTGPDPATGTRILSIEITFKNKDDEFTLSESGNDLIIEIIPAAPIEVSPEIPDVTMLNGPYGDSTYNSGTKLFTLLVNDDVDVEYNPKTGDITKVIYRGTETVKSVILTWKPERAIASAFRFASTVADPHAGYVSIADGLDLYTYFTGELSQFPLSAEGFWNGYFGSFQKSGSNTIKFTHDHHPGDSDPPIRTLTPDDVTNKRIIILRSVIDTIASAPDLAPITFRMPDGEYPSSGNADSRGYYTIFVGEEGHLEIRFDPTTGAITTVVNINTELNKNVITNWKPERAISSTFRSGSDQSPERNRRFVAALRDYGFFTGDLSQFPSSVNGFYNPNWGSFQKSDRNTVKFTSDPRVPGSEPLITTLTSDDVADKRIVLPKSVLSTLSLSAVPAAEPQWIPPDQSQFGGSIGVEYSMKIGDGMYHIKLNKDYLLGQEPRGKTGYIYPYGSVIKFDKNNDGILSSTELNQGILEPGCPLCIENARDLLTKSPGGVVTFPISETAEKVACERTSGLKDVNRRTIPCPGAAPPAGTVEVRNQFLQQEEFIPSPTNHAPGTVSANCPASTYCVTNDGSCVKEGDTSGQYLCINNEWDDCFASDEEDCTSKVVGGTTYYCINSEWTSTPTPGVCPPLEISAEDYPTVIRLRRQLADIAASTQTVTISGTITSIRVEDPRIVNYRQRINNIELFPVDPGETFVFVQRDGAPNIKIRVVVEWEGDIPSETSSPVDYPSLRYYPSGYDRTKLTSKDHFVVLTELDRVFNEYNLLGAIGLDSEGSGFVFHGGRCVKEEYKRTNTPQAAGSSALSCTGALVEAYRLLYRPNINLFNLDSWIDSFDDPKYKLTCTADDESYGRLVLTKINWLESPNSVLQLGIPVDSLTPVNFDDNHLYFISVSHEATVAPHNGKRFHHHLPIMYKKDGNFYLFDATSSMQVYNRAVSFNRIKTYFKTTLAGGSLGYSAASAQVDILALPKPNLAGAAVAGGADVAVVDLPITLTEGEEKEITTLYPIDVVAGAEDTRIASVTGVNNKLIIFDLHPGTTTITYTLQQSPTQKVTHQVEVIVIASTTPLEGAEDLPDVPPPVPTLLVTVCRSSQRCKEIDDIWKKINPIMNGNKALFVFDVNEFAGWKRYSDLYEKKDLSFSQFIIPPTKIAPGLESTIKNLKSDLTKNGFRIEDPVDPRGTPELYAALLKFRQKATENGFRDDIIITSMKRNKEDDSFHNTGNAADVRTNNLNLEQRLMLLKAAVETGFGEILHGETTSTKGLNNEENKQIKCFWYDGHGDHLHIGLALKSSKWERCIKNPSESS
ncbi:TPA: hypothetical protein HA241_06235 [Candidatus Woesearchaeota archaeon]|nr:hypothetical protein [Candidatus Woesearchaeota archaeon]